MLDTSSRLFIEKPAWDGLVSTSDIGARPACVRLIACRDQGTHSCVSWFLAEQRRFLPLKPAALPDQFSPRCILLAFASFNLGYRGCFSCLPDRGDWKFDKIAGLVRPAANLTCSLITQPQPALLPSPTPLCESLPGHERGRGGLSRCTRNGPDTFASPMKTAEE